VKSISVTPLIYSSPVMYNTTHKCPRGNPTETFINNIFVLKPRKYI